jgi:uncharacterized cofD-like protein
MPKILNIAKWFYPGLRIKRWISLLVGGIVLIFISSQVSKQFIVLKILSNVLLVGGLLALVGGTAYLLRSFFEAIYPQEKGATLIDIIYKKRLLSKGPRIVAIGGGTGLSTLLEGLKEYTANIAAIVAVADEGGSSGRLREEFGILPPGDLRNCLVSLAAAPQLMRDLFQYRFTEGGGIKGHSFGNLFIIAMTQVTGSFSQAIKESSKVLAISGQVIPSSLDRVRLRAEYSDGTTKEGEDQIPESGKSIKQVLLIPGDAAANQEAVAAIRSAEMVLMGPGSLFTSVIPNLLIKTISEEIAKRNIIKLYIANVMTQPGETDGFTAADHLEVLMAHSVPGVVNCCLVNSGRLQYELLLKYAKEKSFPVIFDRERIRQKGIAAVEADVVSKTDYLRHDSANTARTVMEIYNNYGKKQWKKSSKT